jgi:predicted permease
MRVMRGRALKASLSRLATALRRNRLDDDLREEIEAHIAWRTAQLVAQGMDPRDAAFEARRMFGNVAAIREETREMWGFRGLDTLAQDLRYGLRILRRTPVFTVVAILSLAIGIGASGAAFSLVNAVLLQKLPVRDPDSLAIVRWRSGPTFPFESLNGYASQNDSETSSTSFSRAAFDAIRKGSAGLIEVFGFADLYDVNLSIDGVPESARAHAVTGNYFGVLGLTPAAGRLIVESDDVSGAAPVALISHPYAERRFGRPDAALGRTLVLNGVSFTVVGVTPRGFNGTLQIGVRHDVTIPTSMYGLVTRADDPADPNYWWILMMGRLAPGVSAADAQGSLDLIVKQTVAAARPGLPATALPTIVLEPGSRGQLEERNGMREPLKTVAWVVGIVLLVACANVANLLLARGHARAREIAVRVAMGAPRGRVIRQLLTESLLLALIGGACGTVIAYWLASALLPALTSSSDLPALETQLDWRGLLFVAALATVTSVLVGLAPALRSTNVRPAEDLQHGTRGAETGTSRERLSSSLVILQVALSTLLVIAAGLLVSSARNLQSVDPGFDPGRTLIFTMNPQLNGYEGQRAADLYASALERLAALPGVRSASLSSHTLMANSSSILVSRPAAAPVPPAGSDESRQFERRNLTWRLNVDGRFFETMKIPLLRGRSFSPADSAHAQQVAVVNESLAQQLFGTDDVIGRRFTLGMRPGSPELEIVGLAADARYTSLRRDPPPTAYLHYRQQPVPRATFAVRTAGDPLSIALAVREAMRQVDATIPLTNLRTQEEQIRRSLQQERLFAQLATLLGGVTLVLSAIGVYGLLAYSVSRRTAEIGIRMALGAGRHTVSWMVLRRALVLAAAGLVLGIVGARAGTGVLQSLLYGLSATDPAAVVIAAAIMLGVCLVAAYVPARRASRIDPIIALRE